MSNEQTTSGTDYFARLEATTRIVEAAIGANMVPRDQIAGLIGDIHAALGRCLSGDIADQATPAPVPAVNPKKSVFDDYIICLEDGKKFKSLKRHLSTHYRLTPEEYRKKWGLDAGYPMVAPNYAAARSQLAKRMGLGKFPKAARRAA